MADTSLDDFFAKKDKSKKKTKTKKSTDVEDGSKAVKKEKKKDKDKQNPGGGGTGLRNVLTNSQEDEEWKDFEEEKEVDYSGLRIQNMQIATKEEQDKEAAEAEEEGDDEDGENREKRSGASGPWNKSNDPNSAAPTPKPKPKAAPEPVKEESPAPKVPGKYVPPGARNASISTSSTPSFPSRRKKEAPNMHSEEDFPTLGGGPGGPRFNQYSSSGASDFIDHPGHRKGVNLTLENKFSALQD